MLIKRVTSKGKPVPYTAEEAVGFAVARSAKIKNTMEVIYWIDRKSIVTTKFHSAPTDTNGGWEAWAEGTVHVGKTVAKTGKFHTPKAHAFKTHYKSGKDDWGIPDIVVLPDSVLDLTETNPAKMVGAVPEKTNPINIIGEVKPEPMVSGEVMAEPVAPQQPPQPVQQQRYRRK